MIKTYRKLLIVVFILTLIIEFVSLYFKHVTLYICSSVSIVPIMLFYGFSITKINITQVYFYLFMLLSWAADIMSLSGNSTVFYIGLSLYSFSYMFLGGIFYKILIKDKHTYFPDSYYLVSIFMLIIIIMFSLNSGYSNKIMIVQQLLHVFVLGSVTYRAFNLRKNKLFKLYFIPGVIILLFTNLLYAIDVMILHQKYPFLDSLDVFLYGIYLLFITKGVLFYKQQ